MEEKKPKDETWIEPDPQPHAINSNNFCRACIKKSGCFLGKKAHIMACPEREMK